MKSLLSFLLVSIALGCTAAGGFGNRLSLFQEKAESVSNQETESTKLPPPDKATDKAPDLYKVKFETTQGDFVLEIHRDWAPLGADRFYNLVKIGYFKDIAIFRAIDGFMFQFGIHGDPEVNEVWSEAKFDDDPAAGHSNTPGTMSFATSGKNSRSVQLFINLGDNARLDSMGFTPIGKISENAETLGKINTTYGENSREVQGRFQAEGNKFIKEKYPKIDFIKSVTLIDVIE